MKNLKFKLLLSLFIIIMGILIIELINCGFTFNKVINKDRQIITLNNLNIKYKKINKDYVSYALDMNYKANKNKLSNNNDNVSLMQEAKDYLYKFNLDVTSYKEECSIFYIEPCSFEVYRAYSSDYENEDKIKDHISGYDVDLKLPYISRGSLKGHKTGNYIIENAKKYGFINLYKNKTNRADRYSHFRYVGVENALLIDLYNIETEKYINSFISNIIYYVKSQDIYMYKTTITKNKIKLPKKNDYKIYMISDNKAIVVVYNKGE